jgi:hypothetical protein
MRALPVLLAITVWSASAFGDARTKDLAAGYVKEQTACKRSADGVQKVTTGTEALVTAGEKQYSGDLDALKAGLDKVQAYCGELATTLELLADPNASYKALERQLDDHDNKIRKLRAAGKKALGELDPVIGRMVPAINAKAGAAAPVTKKTPLKFPSGRAVDAPAFAGTWKVSGSESTDTAEYVEGKTGATITVRSIASCDAQKKALKDAIDLTPSDATKPLGLAWYVATSKDVRRVRSACRASKTGAVFATLDEPTPAPASWPELEPVLAAMIAARK